MTREKALSKVKGYLTDLFSPEEYYEVEEIMTALEQEHCDDCISRQAVLDKAFEIKTGKYTSAMVVYAHDIRILPPVTQQPKTGHWIGDKCSECGEERAWYGNNPPYCPDCGVKMIESQESEG